MFFTVALADRRSDLLVRQVDRLRDAVRRVRADSPFGIDAWVVLPDHLHAVWEHHIRDEADFDAHIRYCWGNPVKHGLVRRAVDWPYSSIHRDIRDGRAEPEWSGAVPEGRFGE